MTEINSINSMKIYTGGSYYYIKVEAGGLMLLSTMKIR